MYEAMRSDEPNSSERSSDLPTGSSDSDQKPSAVDLLNTTRNIGQNWSIHHHDLATNAMKAALAARDSPPESKSEDFEERNSESSSMVVLARHKRRSGRDSEGDPNNESSLTNTTINSGGSSTTYGGGSSLSSDKRVRIQLPSPGEDAKDRSDLDEGEPVLNDVVNEDDRPGGQSSTSFSDDRNHTSSSSSEDPVNAPENGYRLPTVVSEYSSSNRTSSGNSNALSASGSGSAGNTASGTGSGSGSNQGGSSGSGNDQMGGLSSHFTGSSGSGNDGKGSSEEIMDNSGENNSGENNSDSSNKAKSAGITNSVPGAAQSPAQLSDTHHYHSHHHPSLRPPNCHSHAHDEEDAARERKLHDKKRKRMNMRREYEEKVEQEMESHEGSRGKEIVLRPGKPVTLDKVLSFTKTPRLVVKARSPFLVVYANASYYRLSGIDSHNAVGKPIANLLAVPNHCELTHSDKFASVPAKTDTNRSNNGMISSTKNIDIGQVGREGGVDGSQNHIAAAEAGRARATVSSKEDNTEIGLEPLIAASGFGRLQVINVRVKPNDIVGRNINVVKRSSSQKRVNDEGSNAESSITSSYGTPANWIPCTMSISPVVSTPEAYNAAQVTDREVVEGHNHKPKRSEANVDGISHPKGKRRKNHHHPQLGEDIVQQHPFPTVHPWKETSKRHLITHFVIQLEVLDGDPRKFGTMESQSSASTAAEAKILGMTKAEVRRHRLRKSLKSRPSSEADHENFQDPTGELDEESNDEIESEEGTESREHVSAVG